MKSNRKDAFDLIEKYRRAFPSPDGTLIGKEMTEDLIKRKFLVKKSGLEAVEAGIKVTDYDVSGRFTEAFIDEHQAGNEVWDSYPTFLESSGKRFPLTAMDKNVFRSLYWNSINGSRKEHLEILEDLVYAKEKGLIRMKIENFVRSEGWEGIRKERLGLTTVTTSNVAVNENEF